MSHDSQFISRIDAIQEALAKLSDADRKLAVEQRFCPVLRDSRLGSMGTPVRLAINGKPVFICCDGCRKRALADPEATLKRVEAMKGKAFDLSARQATGR